MVLVSGIPGTSSSASPSQPSTSKHIKENAQKFVIRHFKGATPMSLVKTITTLFDQASLRETDDDIQGALFKYYQAAAILQTILQHHEYQQEVGKGNHGALYKLVENTLQYFTTTITPRIHDLERRYVESASQAAPSSPTVGPPSPSDDAPNQRPGGSIQDRMRALAGAGMDMSTIGGPRAGLGTAPTSKRFSHQATASMPASSLQKSTIEADGRASPNGLRKRSSRTLSLSQVPTNAAVEVTAHPDRPVGSLRPDTTSTTPSPQSTQPDLLSTPNISAPTGQNEISGQHITRFGESSHGSLAASGSSPLHRPLPVVPQFPSQPPSPLPPPISPSLPLDSPSKASFAPLESSPAPGNHLNISSSSYHTPSTPIMPSTSAVPPITPSILHFNSMFPSIDEFDPTFDPSNQRNQPDESLSTLEAIEGLKLSSTTDTLSSLNALPSVSTLPSLPKFPSVPTGRVGERPQSGRLSPPPSAPQKELWRDMPVQSALSTLSDLSARTAQLPNGSPNQAPWYSSASQATSPPTTSRPAPPSSQTHGSEGPNTRRPAPPNIPRSTTIQPKELANLLTTSLRILLLDVREREAFERERINGADIVCIEPILLTRGGMNSVLLEDALVMHEDESRRFNDRAKYDLIVIYDQGSESPQSPRVGVGYQPSTAPESRAILNSLRSMIYHNEFIKNLDKPPMTLIGGLNAWIKEMGADSKWVLRDGSTHSSSHNKKPLDERNGVINIAHPQPQPINGMQRTSVHGHEDVKDSHPEYSKDQGENAPPNADAEPINTLRRRSALLRPSSSGNISAYNRPISEVSPNLYASHSPITYPSRAVSPPNPSSLSSSYQPMYAQVSPPPAAVSPPGPRPPQPSMSNISSPSSRRRSDYLEQAQFPYSGSIPNGTTRVPIDYPSLSAQHLVQPPPPALSTTMERPDNRPRHAHVSSQSLRPGSLNSGGPLTTGPLIIDGKPLLPPPTIKSYYPVVYWTRDQVGLSGLKNLGNTCYTNSIIQCLSATVPFARFFIDGRWKSAVNLHNPLGTRGALAEAFSTLVHDMWQAEVPVQSPYVFRKQICLFASQFAGTDQHDAQEFLSFLLDGLHEDLNRVLKKPPNDPPSPQREEEIEHLPQQIAGAQEWRIYQMRDDSIIVDYFQGQFRNRLSCLTCGKTSTTYNSFMYLSLPIPTGRGVTKVSIEQCLQAFVKEEVLEKAEAWKCPRCKTFRKATKQLSLSRLPPVLLIHLKRFSIKGHFTDKLESTVTFPIRGLDLTNYMPPPLPPGEDKMKLYGSGPADDPRTQIPPYRYDLYGVTNHYGTLSGGHYTAFIGTKGSWVYCDDSRLREADERDIVSPAAYILFYKRVRT